MKYQKLIELLEPYKDEQLIIIGFDEKGGSGVDFYVGDEGVLRLLTEHCSDEVNYAIL